MRHFSCLLLCFALATFSRSTYAQTVEDMRCDTAALHALFNASVQEIRKQLHGDMEPNLVRATALPATITSKRDSCLMQCETFVEWPQAWTDALRLTTVPIRAAVDQRVFIKRPIFSSTRTCSVPYHVAPTEWGGGWSGFLEFRKRGLQWRFKRNRTTGVSCGSF